MSSVLYDVPGPRAKALDRALTIGFSVVFALAGLYAVYSMYQRGVFDERWAVLWDPPKGQTAADVWGSMLKALRATLVAAALAAPVALALGAGFAILRRGVQNALVSGGSTLVIELFRGLPVLFNMMLAKLVFGWSPLWSVFYGLVAYNLAVVAEILRAGLAALPKGQREAGLSIGMSPMRTTLLIELPQAVRIMLPALISQLVVLLKDTSLGYIIAYPELLRTIKTNRDYFGGDYLLPFFVVGAIMYIGVNIAIARLATYLERRLREGRGQGPGGTAAGTDDVPPTDPMRAAMMANTRTGDTRT